MIEDRKNWVTGIFSTLTISTKVNNFEVIHFFFSFFFFFFLFFLTLAKGLDKVIRKKNTSCQAKKKNRKIRSKKKTRSKGSNIQKIIPLSYSTKQYFFFSQQIQSLKLVAYIRYHCRHSKQIDVLKLLKR